MVQQKHHQIWVLLIFFFIWFSSRWAVLGEIMRKPSNRDLSLQVRGGVSNEKSQQVHQLLRGLRKRGKLNLGLNRNGKKLKLVLFQYCFWHHKLITAFVKSFGQVLIGDVLGWKDKSRGGRWHLEPQRLSLLPSFSRQQGQDGNTFGGKFGGCWGENAESEEIGHRLVGFVI